MQTPIEPTQPQPVFRKMRRSAQELSEEQCREILARNITGVLAVSGDGGYPYAVPLNYACEGDSIYFHCAREGHKLDAIIRCGKVSFCVIDRDELVAEEYTDRYRSVIVFGQARVLMGEDEKHRALALFTERLVPGRPEESARRMKDGFADVCMVEVAVEHFTGKESRSLPPQHLGR